MKTDPGKSYLRGGNVWVAVIATIGGNEKEDKPSLNTLNFDGFIEIQNLEVNLNQLTFEVFHNA